MLGCNPLKISGYTEVGEMIEVDDKFERVREYLLTEISSVFAIEMRGLGPCHAGVY